MTNGMLRIAMRCEGNFWNAYVAQPNTMEGALLLGSIAITPCKQNPEIKNAFMELMQAAFNEFLKSQGIDTIGFETRPAPEHEKAGRA